MKKILIIRFSSIGDIILTTPIIRCLKSQLKCELHYLTKENYKSILDNNPHIDKTHSLEKELSDTIQTLKTENYDYIIDLHNNLRTFLIKRKLNIPSKAFKKLNLQKWLLVHLKWNKMPNKHIVNRYFETTNAFSLNIDDKGLEYYIHPNNNINLKEHFTDLVQPYIALSIGGQHKTKQLPPHKIIEITSNVKYPIILLGGKEDINLAKEVMQSNQTNLYNACGQFNLDQSASIIEQSKAVITNDTGLMHIAAAFQKPIAAIWGNTVPSFGMHPYLSQSNYKNFEVEKLNCRPCSKIGFETCPEKHFNCMNQQDSIAISDYINLL